MTANTRGHKRPDIADKQILACIRKSVKDRGFPPTIREIGECVGLSSPGSVHRRIKGLIEAGLIVKDASSSRAIRIVEEGKK